MLDACRSASLSVVWRELKSKVSLSGESSTCPEGRFVGRRVMATVYAQFVQIRIVFYLGWEVNCMEASTETEHKVLKSLFPTIQTSLFPSLCCTSSLFQHPDFWNGPSLQRQDSVVELLCSLLSLLSELIKRIRNLKIIFSF